MSSSARGRRARPASVRCTRLPMRSNKRASSCCSSVAMRSLMAGWARCRRSAARENDPVSATAKKASRLAVSITSFLLVIQGMNIMNLFYSIHALTIRQMIYQTSAFQEPPLSAKTLYDKLWDNHLVKQRDDGSALLYIDRHLLHEVTSPQAFEGLRLAGRKPWRIDANLATPDHNVPTDNRAAGVAGIEDEVSKLQV